MEGRENGIKNKQFTTNMGKSEKNAQNSTAQIFKAPNLCLLRGYLPYEKQLIILNESRAKEGKKVLYFLYTQMKIDNKGHFAEKSI